jgi:hypothetical protein
VSSSPAFAGGPVTHAKGLSEVSAGSLGETAHGGGGFHGFRHNLTGVGLTASRVARFHRSILEDIGTISFFLMSANGTLHAKAQHGVNNP